MPPSPPHFNVDLGGRSIGQNIRYAECRHQVNTTTLKSVGAGRLYAFLKLRLSNILSTYRRSRSTLKSSVCFASSCDTLDTIGPWVLLVGSRADLVWNILARLNDVLVLFIEFDIARIASMRFSTVTLPVAMLPISMG